MFFQKKSLCGTCNIAVENVYLINYLRQMPVKPIQNLKHLTGVYLIYEYKYGQHQSGC